MTRMGPRFNLADPGEPTNSSLSGHRPRSPHIKVAAAPGRRPRPSPAAPGPDGDCSELSLDHLRDHFRFEEVVEGGATIAAVVEANREPTPHLRAGVALYPAEGGWSRSPLH